MSGQKADVVLVKEGFDSPFCEALGYSEAFVGGKWGSVQWHSGIEDKT